MLFFAVVVIVVFSNIYLQSVFVFKQHNCARINCICYMFQRQIQQKQTRFPFSFIFICFLINHMLS
jgi:hypothetical protein